MMSKNFFLTLKVLVLFCLFLLVPELVFGAENVTQFEARNHISDLQLKIIDMDSLPVMRLEDNLDEMNFLFNEADFNGVFSLYQDSLKIINEIQETQVLLNQNKFLLDEVEKRGLLDSDLLNLQITGENFFRMGNLQLAKSTLLEVENVSNALLKNFSQIIVENFLFSVGLLKSFNVSTSLIEGIEEEVVLANKSGDVLKIFLLDNQINNIINATKNIKELNDVIVFLYQKNFSTSRFEDLLVEIDLLLDSQSYDEINGLVVSARVLKEEILDLNNEIFLLEQELSKQDYAGINFEEVFVQINNSKQEFFRENYEQSRISIDSANDVFVRVLQVNYMTAVFNRTKLIFDPVVFFKNNWWKLFLFVFVVVIFKLFFLNYLKKFYFEKKLAILVNEKNTILSLLKNLQSDYFKYRVVDKKTYNFEFNHNQERISAISELVVFFEDKISVLSSRIVKRNFFLKFFLVFSKKKLGLKLSEQELAFLDKKKVKISVPVKK